MAVQNKILIIFGSQTNCSQEVAERLARHCRLLLFHVSLSPLDLCELTDFVNSPLVIVVCSTAGQGDIPDNTRVILFFLLTRFF